MYWPNVPVDSKQMARDKMINYQTVFGFNKLEDPTLEEAMQQEGTTTTTGNKIASLILGRRSNNLGWWVWFTVEIK